MAGTEIIQVASESNIAFAEQYESQVFTYSGWMGFNLASDLLVVDFEGNNQGRIGWTWQKVNANLRIHLTNLGVGTLGPVRMRVSVLRPTA